MALSDVLYPGNAEKREKIIRRSQELLELMKGNFRATNSLTEIVNTHLGSSFRPIALDEKATVKENCEVMIKRVHEIQAKVQQVDEELKEKLEPALYERLKQQCLGAHDFSNLKRPISAVCQNASAVLVTYLMKNIKILKNITCTCAKIAVGVISTIVLGLIIDLVVSAIIGAFEQSNLDETLAEYEEALAEFRPASVKYQDTITEVKIMLKCSKKK